MRRLLLGLGLVALLLAGLVSVPPAPGYTQSAPGWTLYLPYLNQVGLATATPTPAPPPTVTATATRLIIPRPSLFPILTRTVTPTATATSQVVATATPTLTVTQTPTPVLGAVLILPAIADTFLTEGRPASAWGAFPGMFIGYDWQGWRRQRALVRFDLSQLPHDALVLDATMEIFIHNCFECYPIAVTTYRVTHAWDEAFATWDTSAEGYAEAYGSSVLNPSDGQHWKAFDLTELTRTWAKGFANHGVMLRGGEEPVSQDPVLYDFWGLDAREGIDTPPRLIIRWLPE